MKIVVFTGAGVSRESGLKTFRDSEDGLWEGYDVREVASPEGWRADPEKVLAFYDMRRREVLDAQPNEAHRAIAELEKNHDVVVITQNIDDLHERAGSTQVIHLHGEILKVRPVNDETDTLEWTGDLPYGTRHPKTGALLRPFVVWFGEGLPELNFAMEIALARDVDVLIVVGTTLQVFPAAFVATESRAERIFVVDPNPPDWERHGLTVIAEPATTGMRKVMDLIGRSPHHPIT